MRRVAALVTALTLAACASLPPPVPLDGVPSAFRVAGRLSVSQDGRGEIFRLRWDRTLENDVWTIFAPVGGEVARIERGPEGVQITRAGAVPMTASSLAEVTRALLGVDLDERLLAAWVHGRPVSGPARWDVEIEPSSRVPGLAHRIRAASGPTTVRFVVDDYEVSSP